MLSLNMLVGKPGRCGQEFSPLFYIIPYEYASGDFSLRENYHFLYSTHKGYIKLIKNVKCKPKHEDDTWEICVAIG